MSAPQPVPGLTVTTVPGATLPPVIVLIALVLLITSCSTVTAGRARPSDAPAAAAADPCPDTAVEPAAARPVVDLRFDLDADGRTVTGTERVRFTTDLATDEMVFRLTANQPMSVAAGSGIEVGEVDGEDVESVAFERAGAEASTQGGLLVLQLRRTLRPGQATDVHIDFRLRLGAGTFDRFGQDRQASWWGSGHPLLGWVPGQGWSREPLLDALGETAASPAARTTVTVQAPADRAVLMTGGADRIDDDGQVATWRSSSPAARDVSVAVGEFVTAELSVGATRIVVGATGADEAQQVLDLAGRAVLDLQQYFGPFPFTTLSLVRLADYGGGIEYPGLILLAAGGSAVLTHEVAHMWFYGMVGNDQGQYPWLDESFATYAEALVSDRPGSDGALEQTLDVGLPVRAYPDPETYFDIVYGKGAAMLMLARDRVGQAPFDAAIRCYVNANAWQVASPRDVQEALEDYPDALTVLRDAGAL